MRRVPTLRHLVEDILRHLVGGILCRLVEDILRHLVGGILRRLVEDILLCSHLMEGGLSRLVLLVACHPWVLLE